MQETSHDINSVNIIIKVTDHVYGGDLGLVLHFWENDVICQSNISINRHRNIHTSTRNFTRHQLLVIILINFYWLLPILLRLGTEFLENDVICLPVLSLESELKASAKINVCAQPGEVSFICFSFHFLFLSVGCILGKSLRNPVKNPILHR